MRHTAFLYHKHQHFEPIVYLIDLDSQNSGNVAEDVVYVYIDLLDPSACISYMTIRISFNLQKFARVKHT